MRKHNDTLSLFDVYVDPGLSYFLIFVNDLCDLIIIL